MSPIPSGHNLVFISVQVPATSRQKPEDLPYPHFSLPEFIYVAIIVLGVVPLAVASLIDKERDLQLVSGLHSAIHKYKIRRALKAGNVGVIAKEGAPGFYSKFYAIPIELPQEDKETGELRITVVQTDLTDSGSVEYLRRNLDADKVTIPKSGEPQLSALQEIAPIVQERFDLLDQLDSIQRNGLEAEKMQALVRSSDLYSAQAELFERVQQQQKQAINRIHKLIEVQDRCIRESLIAARIHAFDLSQIVKQRPALDAQLQQLQHQYQDTKEYIQSYLELMHQGESRLS